MAPMTKNQKALANHVIADLAGVVCSITTDNMVEAAATSLAEFPLACLNTSGQELSRLELIRDLRQTALDAVRVIDRFLADNRPDQEPNNTAKSSDWHQQIGKGAGNDG